MLSRLATRRIFGTIFSIDPKSLGSTRYSQVWTWEERSMNSECGSDQRTSGIESYVWFRRLWRSVSQRHLPRETESMCKRSSHSKHCWFQTQRQQWTRNEREYKKGRHNNRESPLCCIDRHPPIQKYMYIPVNVKSNLKWGNNIVLDESVHM